MNPALDRAVAATKMPAFGFERDYSQGVVTEFPEFSQLRSVPKWLSARAILLAKAGNELGMAEDLRAILKISDFADTDGILHGQLVAVAIENIAWRAAQDCLTIRNGSPGTIRAVRDAMKSLGPVPSIRTAMRYEYYFAMSLLLDLIEKRDPELLEAILTFGGGKWAGVSLPLVNTFLMEPGMLKANAKNVLETKRLTYLALPQDPLDLPKVKAAFAAQASRLAAKESNREFYLAQVMSEDLVERAGFFAQTAQQRHLVEILLRCLEERNRTGKFPAKLPVKGALATDLFDGGVLRYSVKSGRVKVYSVGPDGNDNGGIGPSTSPGDGEHDIVVSFPSE